MTDVQKAEREMVAREARELSRGLSETIKASPWDKRSVVFATMKLAAGTARATNMSKHAAMTLFLTMYQDADEHFKRKGKRNE